MVQLSATMEQTHETQLAQLYDVLGLRRVIALYDVLRAKCINLFRCVSTSAKFWVSGTDVDMVIVTVNVVNDVNAAVTVRTVL